MSASYEKRKARVSELKYHVEQLTELPTLPSIAVKLIEVTGDEDASLAEISQLIENDPSLASKVLKLANSSYFGVSRQVNSVQHATSLLGLDLVRTIALSIMVFHSFQEEESESFKIRDFWHHNLACAIGGEILSRELGYSKPEEAFVAGLMHDLGKIVLFHWSPDLYESLVKKSREQRTTLLQLEEVQLGMGHTQVAKLLMEKWKFPAPIILAAWLHHQPTDEFSASNPGKELPFIIKCANSLVHLHQFGHSGNWAGDLDYDRLTGCTGLNQSRLQALGVKVLQRFEEVSEMFDWDATTPDIYFSAIHRASQELGRIQLELVRKTREARNRDLALNSICSLQENLRDQSSLRGSLQAIISNLPDLDHYLRAAALLPVLEEKRIEVLLKEREKSQFDFVTVELEDSHCRVLRRGISLMSFLRSHFPQIAQSLPAHVVLNEMLGSELLQSLTLFQEDHPEGLLLVEPEASTSGGAYRKEQLDQYSRMAAIGLERVRLVERLDQQAEEMAKAAREVEKTQSHLFRIERLASVGRLAASAAHDINNPLTSISAHAQLTLRSVKDERVRQAFELIIEQGDRIAKIISDLMGFARPAPPQVKQIRLNQVLDIILRALESRIRMASISLQTNIPEDLPEILADSKQLEQVFLNLGLNAIQAMDRGGTLTIEAWFEPADKRILVSVADTGKGIPPQRLSKIFEPFFTTKDDRQGTGLGLAICKTLVEAHGGSIEVDSRVGQGSCFTVILPVKDPELSTEESEGQPASQETTSPSLTGSILVIDDEEALRGIIKSALQAEGFQVTLAENGEKGLEQVQQNDYDVVLLDLRMPGPKGTEILKALSQDRPELPVVVISGVAREQELSTAQLTKAFACIKKPFRIDDLVETVRRAVQA